MLRTTYSQETSNVYFLLNSGSRQLNMPSLVMSACDCPRLQVFQFLLFCWLCASYLHVVSMGLQFPFTAGSTIFSITAPTPSKESTKIYLSHFVCFTGCSYFSKDKYEQLFTTESSKSSWSNPKIKPHFFPLLVWIFLTSISSGCMYCRELQPLQIFPINLSIWFSDLNFLKSTKQFTKNV